mmetsp:Transcript_39678/g.84898  ORF Transcript_39678/g.84898 Transcript_39678/m.84898 type:complete len:370 (-) Transcript_39678:77-1186(-)
MAKSTRVIAGGSSQRLRGLSRVHSTRRGMRAGAGPGSSRDSSSSRAPARTATVVRKRNEGRSEEEKLQLQQQQPLQALALSGLLAALPQAALAEAASTPTAQQVAQHHNLIDSLFVAVESAAVNSGPFGWAVLASFIATSELLPLVPTQPLSLISGLVFGASKGAMISLVGTTAAASIAFKMSSGPLGARMRQLAMEAEGGAAPGTATGALGSVGSSLKNNPLLKKLGDGVEDLGPSQQMFSVILLRLSPVVPYSISNYLLGLTPIRFLPFVAGTFVGMSPWCLLYATLGKTAGAILHIGAGGTGEPLSIDGIEDLGAFVQQQLAQYSEEIELLGVGTFFMLALVLFTAMNKDEQQAIPIDDTSDKRGK